MPILPSRSRDIQDLIAQLGEPRIARRDAAVAKLTLLGERGVSAAVEALRSASPSTRLGALAVLGRVGSARSRAEVLALIEDEDDAVAGRAAEVAASAYPGGATTGVLARHLGSPRARVRRAATEGLLRMRKAGVEEAVEPLLQLLFDEGADEDLRLLVLESVSHFAVHEQRLLLQSLRNTRSARLSNRIAALEATTPSRRPAGKPPSQREGAAAILALHRQIERLNEKVAAGGDLAAIAAAKSRVHLELARLGSRLALHDLREMLAARPVREAGNLLEAAGDVGDKTFVPVLARLAAEEPMLFGMIAAALAKIARRERLRMTRRLLLTVPSQHRTALERLWRAFAGRHRST